jgi:uncharacterized protein YcbX
MSREPSPAVAPVAVQIAVTGLFVYPIKSCRGTSLQQADAGARGILHDREFMVVDAQSGLFLTQRELPRMALIRPSLSDGALCVEAPDMPMLTVSPSDDGPVQKVRIWSDTCRAVDQGSEAAAWFSRFLAHECRLVRMADNSVRRVDDRYATSNADQVGFADGYPFLLISRESLDELNRRVAEPLPMDRFRPNIVVAGGGAPHLEDGWKRIRVGSMLFHVVKPCARCTIPTTDQQTGVQGKEPLTTLATYRRSARGAVLFGQNLIHSGSGTLRLGDPLTVVE